MTSAKSTFTFEENKRCAERLDTKYPFLSCRVIGRTDLGRGIFAFSLGCETNPVVICGGANEKSRITSAVLYKFIDRLCESVYLGRKISGIDYALLTEKYGITVIPCINPDFSPVWEGERAFSALCRRRNFRSCLTVEGGGSRLYFNPGKNRCARSVLAFRVIASSCVCGVSESGMPRSPSLFFTQKLNRPSYLLEIPEGKAPDILYAGIEETLVLTALV